MAIPNGLPAASSAINIAAAARTLANEQGLNRILKAETMGPFQQQMKIAAMCPVKMISGGKSYQWILNGKVSAAYRTTPGAYEVGTDDLRFNEVTIGIDKEIVSLQEIDDYAEFTAWHSARSAIVTEVGSVLGRVNEVKASKALFVAGNTDMPAGILYTDIAGGNDMRTAAARNETISGCGAATRTGFKTTDGTGFVNALRNIAVKIYEMGDDPSLYSIYLAPTDYSFVSSSEGIKACIDKDFNSNNGDLAMSNIPRIAGIGIERAPGITTAAFTSVTAGWITAAAERNNYVSNNSVVLGVVARIDKAIAGVGLYDVTTEAFRDPRTDTWNFRGKSCIGYGALEAQCAFKVSVAV